MLESKKRKYTGKCIDCGGALELLELCSRGHEDSEMSNMWIASSL